ncbi:MULTISPECIES: DUF1922 domain-containing protein [Methanobacterium]|jgi:predicted kinase|uniref:DUF1922 domain-containing protein n=1 Tax=Methanobacterium subterraneum TaxID=59277 RepID=A0A2H4VR10_9EURY|nr:MULTISPECIES: DUF1922 domain-containing protein [Methanobacterium]MBW4258324.1 DUF1922 domain-containing protein [Methanobacterium sp. YSL]PKL74053.1 MAG: DUF1922 domain-containing protein [Methanobacteriales archaeon HGW-Methanobacteriales-2]AUB55599.1 hypothetical protein BK007_05975 [Methanobacterium subterraneum]AUB57418.1 hypothetical protein BK008_03170 [Methanobacterium sp. MZ-A1]AUB60539.1 hypothetical protein BK009_07515 [Methanobacterium subterraneum]
MYLIFRCNCGRAVYAKESVKVKKCVCGKNLKVAERRIIARTEDPQTASEKVQELQEEKYGGAYFTTADKI